VVE
jgi:hypothetical protein